MGWRDYETMARPGRLEYGAAVSVRWTPEEERREIERLSSGQRMLIGGYATRFFKPHASKYAECGIEAFAPGAFARTLIEKSDVRLLEDHEERKLLGISGASLHLWADNVGLSFKAELPNTFEGQRVYAGIKAGAKCGLSIGYRTDEAETKRIAGSNIRIIYAARLNEISIVDEPAVPGTFAVCLADGEKLDRPFIQTKGEADLEAAAARFKETLRAAQKVLAERA